MHLESKLQGRTPNITGERGRVDWRAERAADRWVVGEDSVAGLVKNSDEPGVCYLNPEGGPDCVVGREELNRPAASGRVGDFGDKHCAALGEAVEIVVTGVIERPEKHFEETRIGDIPNVVAIPVERDAARGTIVADDVRHPEEPPVISLSDVGRFPVRIGNRSRRRREARGIG